MSSQKTHLLRNNLSIKESNELVSSLLIERKKTYAKLSDSKINLNNNKEILSSIISNSNLTSGEYNNSDINDLLSENRFLLEKLSDAFKTKNLKEKELNQILIGLESRFKWEREKIATSNNEIDYINNKLKEKDRIIQDLKCEINKHIGLVSEINKEVYLEDPKKKNIDSINEIAYTIDIIKKFSHIYESEKKSKHKFDAELNQLQKEYGTFNRNKTGFSTNDYSKKDSKFTSTNLNLQIARKNEISSTSNLNLSELQSREYNNYKNFEESPNVYKKINKNEIDLNASKLSNISAVESDIDFNLINESQQIEEIQNIKFPDKVIMKQQTHNKRNSDLPRLDMSRVYQRYQPQNNLHIIKPVKKASLSSSKKSLGHSRKLFKNSTISHFTSKLNNIKSEVNQTNQTIKNLENEIGQFKKIYKDNKNKHVKIKENLKIADSKIEILKNQIKQISNKEIKDDLISDSDSDSFENNDQSQEFSYISIDKDSEDENA